MIDIKIQKKILKSVKAKNYWTIIYFVDPIAIPLAYLLSFLKWIKPNNVTLTSLFFMAISVYFFCKGTLCFGSLFYYISLILDKTDGKLARMTGRVSVFGGRLDILVDRVNKLLPLLAILYGYYYRNGQLVLGVALIFGLHYGIHFLYHYLFKIKLSASSMALIEIPREKRPFLFGLKRVYNIFSSQDEAFFILIVGPFFGLVTETIIGVSAIYLILAPIMWLLAKKKR